MTTTVHFDGFDVRQYVDKVNDIDRGLMAPRDIKTTQVGGMDGEYFVRAKTGSRPVGLTIQIIEKDKSVLRQRVDQLAEVLLTEKTAPLVFGDEPNMTYWAVVTDDTPLEELRVLGKATIKFIVPKGYKYGVEQTNIPLTLNGTTVENYVGTAPANPVFTVDFVASATYFEVIKGDEKVRANYSFPAGSQLIIDHDSNKVTIDGVVQQPAISKLSVFFELLKGDNTLETATDSTDATISMDYIERWK